MVKYLLYLTVFSTNHSYMNLTIKLRTTTLIKAGDILSHSWRKKFQYKVNLSFREEGGGLGQNWTTLVFLQTSNFWRLALDACIPVVVACVSGYWILKILCANALRPKHNRYDFPSVPIRTSDATRSLQYNFLLHWFWIFELFQLNMEQWSKNRIVRSVSHPMCVNGWTGNRICWVPHPITLMHIVVACVSAYSTLKILCANIIKLMIGGGFVWGDGGSFEPL